MTKKNIRPQQAAPVQRETVGINSSTEGKITGQWRYEQRAPWESQSDRYGYDIPYPSDYWSRGRVYDSGEGGGGRHLKR